MGPPAAKGTIHVTVRAGQVCAWLSGAAAGIGLFAVVGAQSAFILRQGILRKHIVPVVATCAAIDAIFIFASVAGLRTLPRVVEEALGREEDVRALAEGFVGHDDVYFIGRGLDYAVVEALVVEHGLPHSLLGMSYLGRLSSFSATPVGLTLRP